MPDVNGTPPKMKEIADRVREHIEGLAPVIKVTCDDNLMSSIIIRGAFDSPDEWSNGIFENGLYFILHIIPEKGKRYYTPGEKITLEAIHISHQIANVDATAGIKRPKFRKYTGTVDKVISRLQNWMQPN